MGRTKRAPAPPEIDERLPATFFIPGRAVPWRAPVVTNNGVFSLAKQKVWKLEAQAVFKRFWKGEPSTVSIHLRITLDLRKFGHIPDCTNCGKLIEDALQGILIANDRQVERIETRRCYVQDESDERVWVEVSQCVPWIQGGKQ
jgi:Holliday junction resolvase RusA-like endonuclease